MLDSSRVLRDPRAMLRVFRLAFRPSSFWTVSSQDATKEIGPQGKLSLSLQRGSHAECRTLAYCRRQGSRDALVEQNWSLVGSENDGHQRVVTIRNSAPRRPSQQLILTMRLSGYSTQQMPPSIHSPLPSPNRCRTTMACIKGSRKSNSLLSFPIVPAQDATEDFEGAGSSAHGVLESSCSWPLLMKK